jgi:hypothetical protein
VRAVPTLDIRTIGVTLHVEGNRQFDDVSFQISIINQPAVKPTSDLVSDRSR